MKYTVVPKPPNWATDTYWVENLPLPEGYMRSDTRMGDKEVSPLRGIVGTTIYFILTKDSHTEQSVLGCVRVGMVGKPPQLNWYAWVGTYDSLTVSYGQPFLTQAEAERFIVPRLQVLEAAYRLGAKTLDGG